MSNMSYCRFENTLNDLRDCYENINDTEMSSEELRARNVLIEICKDIIREANEDLEIDEES